MVVVVIAATNAITTAMVVSIRRGLTVEVSLEIIESLNRAQ